ncbi:CPBP family intramembrane metalloprotease [Actinoplanes sp. TRM 88003]|uniref:CPBP family intramembrane metalloprotease n=1 Tax=Paractinoplanes aksuensis TaxID=2939490 RepID=A0ABT1DHQ6_9ACTN|nr:CPBP family intramembrane glutamic endopeptidase [Actinoplanes aksuensis]MCO8270369.1 CPBP family intramembrane metalloprotease [Actinoplanes aksuensis]
MLTAVVLLVMICVRVWNYRGQSAAQPFTGPLAAAALLLIAGAAGLPWADLGLGRPTSTSFSYAMTGVFALAVIYVVALLIPRIRRQLAQATPAPHPWRAALLDIPLATVTFEEVAFRAVLWAALAQNTGPPWATVVTAALFGLWHIPPHRERLPVVVGTVVFTALAGALLSILTQAGGSLLIPFAIHWSANAFGVLAVKAARGKGSARR